MKPWLKWILFPLAALLLLGLAAYGFGLSRPPAVQARASVEIAKPPEAIFPLLADPNNIAKWYPGIQNVEVISQSPRRYRMTTPQGSGGIEVVSEDPPHRLVTKSLEATMGVSGLWDATIVPTASGCRVSMEATITMPPLMRTAMALMDPNAEERKTLEMLRAFAEK